MVYELSEQGKVITWHDWRKSEGCHIRLSSKGQRVLGPESKWPRNITLGDIANACPFSGRSLAYFAATHLKRYELVKLYKRFGGSMKEPNS